MPRAKVPAPSKAGQREGLQVEHLICAVRGRKVMLDFDLARLYGVTTKRLNEQVRRNLERFPEDFLFRLTSAEVAEMRSQFATASPSRRNARFGPWAFTEHGVTMISAVLRTSQAVTVSVVVVRAFVRLRHAIAAHAALARRVDELEKRYDGQFGAVFQALREILAPPPPPKRRIGFAREE